jgi:hypothetical protein
MENGSTTNTKSNSTEISFLKIFTVLISCGNWVRMEYTLDNSSKLFVFLVL